MMRLKEYTEKLKPTVHGITEKTDWAEFSLPAGRQIFYLLLLNGFGFDFISMIF